MLPKHYVAAAGIVLNENEDVLLIRRADNMHWEPPGGVVELEDGLEAAVVREVKEESGVDAEVIRLTGVYKTVGRRGFHVVSLVFLCRAVGGVLRPSEETVAAGFFSADDALNKIERERIRIRLEDALADRKTPFVRSFLTPEAK
ncbi:NUDIX hydrolase [Paludifilum halophilum]|nr:NUDIX domain-containing protein [Paludifilum halophilum]